jgi:hypothetical protein
MSKLETLKGNELQAMGRACEAFFSALEAGRAPQHVVLGSLQAMLTSFVVTQFPPERRLELFDAACEVMRKQVRESLG